MEEEKEELIKKYSNNNIVKLANQYTNEENMEEIKYEINHKGSVINKNGK